MSKHTKNNDIQGITVDTEEIKLGLFADDFTGFLMNDISCRCFWRMFKP